MEFILWLPIIIPLIVLISFFVLNSVFRVGFIIISTDYKNIRITPTLSIKFPPDDVIGFEKSICLSVSWLHKDYNYLFLW